MTLRLRLTIFFSAFMALILSAVAVSVYVLTEQSLSAAVEDRARQALTDLLSNPIETGLLQLPGDAFHQVVLLGGPEDVDLDGAQDIRAGFDFPGDPGGRRNPLDVRLIDALPERAVDELATQGTMTGYATLPNGDRLRVMGALSNTIDFPRQNLRFRGAVLVGLPLVTVDLALAQLAQDLGLTVVLAFLAFALGVWMLSRQVLSPLQRVTQAASRVSSRDLSQRVPVPRSQDEMRELAVALNHMLDRLQESFETQRRFTADASHELRTPVTAIVGHANYVLRRTRPTPEQIDSLTVIRHEADRMGKLVNDLLELARADAGFSIEKEPMNLLEVVEAVRDDYGPVADGATITVDCATPLVEVEGDPTRLKQVVLNLVQNAVNAGAARVTLHLEIEGRTVRLEVLDDGPGIPAEAIPHLFDRFFRVDGARSTRGNGSGLGLAIVRWIVQQHGGTVEVTSKAAEGSVFVVSLPALDPKATEVGRSARSTATDAVAARR